MKKTRKIIVLLLSLVMLLASSVVVSAATAPSYAAPKGVTVIDSTSKNFAKTASLYTDEGAKTYDVKYTYTTKAFVKEGDLRNATLEDLAAMDIHEIVAPSISVSSDNTGALRASYSQVSDLATAKSVKYKSGKSTVTITYTVNGQITLTPVANSKKTVAVKVNYIQYSKGIQKIIAAKTLKVNTLTHAAGIDVTNAEQDEAGNYTLVMANKGTKSLGAVVSNDTASNKKLTYEVIGTKTAKGKNVEGVSVSAAGVVTTTGVALDKDLESTIKITSADKKASVTVSLKTATVDIAKIGFQSSKLALVTNEQDENYQGTVKVFAGRTVGKKTYYDVAIDSTKPTNEMVYVSSNPKVATVDENGVVTAVANGSAKISAYLKYNNSVKTGTVAVTVTTNLTNVSAKNVEVLVGKKVSPQVAINGGASSPITYKYSIVNVNPYEGDSIPVEASPTKANVTAAKAYLTIDKKGVITAKKPCQAQIKVEVKQGSKTPITATYNVAINPGVTSITPEINNVDSVVAVAKNSKGTKAAITISNAAQVKEYEIGANVAFNAAYTQAELEGANKEYIVTSSAPTVLRVYKNAEDKWVMVPMKSGSATIKFATTDGSGKSASVTASVVYKAFGITADTNAKVSDYSDLAALTALDNVTEETPVVLVSTKANKTGKIVVDPKTAINATVTNATAQNQAVKYYVNGSAVTSVTLDVNNNVGTKVVTAKSADNNASATYVIYRPSEAVIAGNGDVTVTPGDAVVVKVGETATAGYTLALNETEASASKNILSKGVTFKSENAKVATVTATGLVKGIAVGNTYIDVTYKSGLDAIYMEKGQVTIDGGVFVGQNSIRANAYGASYNGFKCQIVINDGQFDGNINLATQTGTPTSENQKCVAEINGGVFNGDVIIGKNVVMTVSGGKFHTPSVHQYVAENKYLVESDGSYIIGDSAPSSYKASLNGNTFFVSSANLAVQSAKSEDVIELKANASYQVTLQEGESLTFLAEQGIEYVAPVAAEGFTLTETDVEGGKKYSVPELLPFHVVTTGGTYDYASISQAFATATADRINGTITLMKDYTVSETPSIGQSCTFNLNGHILTFAKNYYFLVSNSSTSQTVTIRDGVGTGKMIGLGNKLISKANKIAMSITGGSFECTGGWVFDNTGIGTVNISGGTFVGKYFGFKYNYDGSVNDHINGAITITTTNSINNYKASMVASGYTPEMSADNKILIVKKQ